MKHRTNSQAIYSSNVQIDVSSKGATLMLKTLIITLAFLLMMCAAHPASAQQASPPPPPPPLLRQQPTTSPAATPTPENQQGIEVDEDDTIEVKTSLVNLQVRVIDRQNRPINTVRKDEIRVFEDGIPQTIEFFSTEEVPISYGLVIDNSGSLRTQLDNVIAAGKTIVNSNKPGDENFLIRFTHSDNIELEQPWTSSTEAINDALDDLFINPGQTSIRDAVYLAADYASERRKGEDNDRRRRALILVTDGEERGSTYSEEKLFARLRESDVQIFVIGLVNDLDDQKEGIIRKSDRAKAVNLINKLATETGGRAFFPNSLAELPQIAEQITRDLRTQYVVSYNPTNKRRDGTYRRIRVAIANDDAGKNKRIALTRAGYNAPSDNAAPVNSLTPAARPTSNRRSN